MNRQQYTRKERFMTAVSNAQPDRIPLFDFLFQQGMYKTLIGRSPENYNAKDAVELALKLEHDAVWVPFGGFQGYEPEWLGNNQYRDEWGTVFIRSNISWPIDSPVNHPIKSREDLKKYRMPDPTLKGRLDEVATARNMENGGLAITPGIQGPLSTVWLLMGFEEICFNLYDDPDFVEDLFRLSNDFFKEAARLSVQAGADALWVSEDMGDSNSTFFSRDMYEKHIFPYFAELVEYIDSLGVPVLLHSCGNIMDYLDLIAETRVASLHPMQRTAGMDIKKIKHEYGKRFCLIGNIDSSATLPYGTAEDVRLEVKDTIKAASADGGYIMASDHSLHDGIPVENILAVRDTCLEFGGYSEPE